MADNPAALFIGCWAKLAKQMSDIYAAELSASDEYLINGASDGAFDEYVREMDRLRQAHSELSKDITAYAEKCRQWRAEYGKEKA